MSQKVMSLVLQAGDVKNSVKSFQLSKKYVKRLMKISLLNIVYHRIDIPQREFESKKYDNIPYVVCGKNSQNNTIRSYHSVAHGILDAIDKDYLKEIYMYILRIETREPLETYNIKIKYNTEDTKSDQKPGKVKQATMEFLKALTDLPGKKWKEENVELFVELTYNEDIPKDYEPPNFEPAPETLSSSLNTFISLGKINTGFHKISAWGRGNNFSESRPSTPAPSSLVENEDDDNVFNEDIREIDDKAKRINRGNKADEREPESKKRKFDKTQALIDSTGETNWENVSIVSSDDYVCCLCKWDLPEEYETVKCTNCYGTVHLPCHGFLTSKAIDKENFKCHSCSDGKNCEKNLNLLMKLRVILYGITLSRSVPDELQLATKDERHYILTELDKFGVRSYSSTSVQDISLKNLQNAVQLVFKAENSQFFE